MPPRTAHVTPQQHSSLLPTRFARLRQASPIFFGSKLFNFAQCKARVAHHHTTHIISMPPIHLGTPEAPTTHPTRYPATPQQQQPPCGFFLKRTIGILSFAGLSTAVFSPWSVSFCIRAPRAARPASPVQSFFKDLGFSPRSSSCLGCAQTGAHQ